MLTRDDAVRVPAARQGEPSGPRLPLSEGPLQLRPYQIEAVEAVLESLDDRPILVSPTGSGKTVMAIASYPAAPKIDDQPVFRTTSDGTLLTIVPPPEEP